MRSDVMCPDSEGVRRARREYQLPASLRIRLIRVELEDGEKDGIKIGKRRRRPKRLGLDKGYDSDTLGLELRRSRIAPIASYRSNRKIDPLLCQLNNGTGNVIVINDRKSNVHFAWINRFRRLVRFLVSQKSCRAFVRMFFIKHYLDRMF